MSTSGFSSSGLSQLESAVHNAEQFLTDFQQLGTDLKGGKLGAAQQDFVTLSQDAQSASSNKFNNAANSNTLSAIEAGFQSLSQSLQGGDLGAAQQSYAQIVQATVSGAAQAQAGQNDGNFAAFMQMLQQLVAGSGSGSTAAATSTTAVTGSTVSRETKTQTSLVAGLAVPSLAVSSTASTEANTTGTTALVQQIKTSTAEETTESAGSDQATQEAELGQPPQLGYGTIGALAAVLKDLGAALGKSNLAGAQSSFAQFVQEAQSGSATGIIGGDWIKSFLELQGSSGGIASSSVTQVNEKA